VREKRRERGIKGGVGEEGFFGRNCFRIAIAALSSSVSRFLRALSVTDYAVGLGGSARRSLATSESFRVCSPKSGG